MTTLKPFPTTTIASVQNMLARFYPDETVMVDLGDKFNSLWLIEPGKPWRLVKKDKNSQYNSLGII